MAGPFNMAVGKILFVTDIDQLEIPLILDQAIRQFRSDAGRGNFLNIHTARFTCHDNILGSGTVRQN